MGAWGIGTRNHPFLFVLFFKKIVLFFLARLICQTRLTSLPSIWVTEPQVQRCHRTRWGRATPGNRTSLPGWPSLLAFAEGLKTNVGCWEAHLPGLALGPLSGPHCTGHQIPQALRDVYFCTLQTLLAAGAVAGHTKDKVLPSWECGVLPSARPSIWISSWKWTSEQSFYKISFKM